jgi:hypothetical protein
MTEAEMEFHAAIATARHALEQFNAEPMLPSKRGGPRLSPWFRAWVQASEVAQRWHRQMERDKPAESFDESEFEQLLADDMEARREKGRWGNEG